MAADLPRPRRPRHHGAGLVPGRRAPAEDPGPALSPGPLAPGQDRAALVAEVARALAPLPPGATVVLACSGGPDSTALALLTAAARPDLRTVVAYVAHGLRGPGIDEAEAALVDAVAARISAAHVVLPVEVVRTGGGPEEDARAVRHAALAAEAVRRDAAAVLYGHHAEDQAATLLLRIARGTGLHGLVGMAGVPAGATGEHGDRPPRLRPLLRLRRADLARVCTEDGLPHAADPMNADRDLRRVRVEEEVLPALARVGPDPVGALGRLADLARDDEAVLADLARSAADALPVRRAGPAVALPSSALRTLPTALSRRLVRRELARLAGALTGVAPDADLAVARVADALTVARVLDAEDGARATLPGPLRLEVSAGWHVLVPEDLPPAGSVRLDVPGGADWPTAGLVITAAVDRAAAAPATGGAVPPGSSGLLPGLEPARLSVHLRHPGPFTVRSRRPGDRLRTPGGTRRLGDVMADAGVPASLRDLLPVVVVEAPGGDGAPVWVPGVVVAEDVRADPGGGAAASALRADPQQRPTPGSDGVRG